MEKEIELEQEAIVVYSGGGAVNSVNGYTGDVVLTTSDLENTSDYQTGTEVESAISTAIAGKQDTLTAGNNITISNNTISATDTTYSAGTGLTLDGTQFNVDTNTIATQQDVSNEATARENADINLQGQIDAISSASDVTDIVGTYAALQAYDTTHLKDNDIIKVLQDESQNDETTYYRWSTSTQTFTLIGEEGPYYTKSQTDTLLQAKQDNLTAGANITIASDNTISATDTTYTAGTNVSISSGNVISATDTTYTAGTGLNLNGTEFSADTSVLATQTDLSSKQNTLTAGSNITISGDTISATDTTYSNFVGTDGTAAGTAGLVPAPATTDAGKFLKADGTWDTAGGGGGIIELTSADYNYPTDNPTQIAAWLLPDGIYHSASTAIQWSAYGDSAVNGTFIKTTYSSNTAFVFFYKENGLNEVILSQALGSTHYTNLSTSAVKQTTGTSTTNVMSQNATTNAIKAISQSGAGAPTTSTVGTVGQLYQDTTNGDLYICTDATNPYVWEEVGAGGGGGPTVVQTTGTSTTDVMSQNATTSLVYADPATRTKIKIGDGTYASEGTDGIEIGHNAKAAATYAIGIGSSAEAKGLESIALGYGTEGTLNGVCLGTRSKALAQNAVAFQYSRATVQGEVAFGMAPWGANGGYNNSNYRLLTGLYDPQSAHDAATKGYVDPTTDSSAPTTATVGRLGQIQIDTTTATAYMCVAVDTVTPAYTWKQITA